MIISLFDTIMTLWFLLFGHELVGKSCVLHSLRLGITAFQKTMYIMLFSCGGLKKFEGQGQKRGGRGRHQVYIERS